MQKQLLRFVETEFFRFLCVGAGSTAISFLSYLVLVQQKLSIFVATLLAYAAGLLFSYILSKLWVFRTTTRSVRQSVPRFLLVYAVGGFGMSAITDWSYSVAGLDYRLAWSTGLIFSIANNYLGGRYFAFKTSA